MFCCSTHNLFSPSVQSYFFLTPWKGKILVLWASNFSGAQFMKLPTRLVQANVIALRFC